MILSYVPTYWDYACADVVIGVGIAAVVMSAIVAYQDWKRTR